MRYRVLIMCECPGVVRGAGGVLLLAGVGSAAVAKMRPVTPGGRRGAPFIRRLRSQETIQIQPLLPRQIMGWRLRPGQLRAK